MLRCDCPTEVDEARLRAYLPRCRVRDALLIELGFETGLRISELLSLKVGDVWKAGAPLGLLKVPRRRLKGGRGIRADLVRGRVIPLNERARAAIGAALSARQGAAECDALFPSRQGGGRALTRRQGSRIIRGIFRRAGLDPTRIWGGHSMRRRFVRRIYEATRDIELTRVAIGHRWVSTTQGYLAFGEEDAAEAILRIGAIPPAQARPAEDAPGASAGPRS